MTEQNKPNEETAKQEQAQQTKPEPAEAPKSEQAQTEEEANEQRGAENFETVKTISALAYLVFFLPLLTNPNSQFGKFHANQALLLLITWLAIVVVSTVIPRVGFIVFPLGFIFCLVLFVKGIINAINGKTERLPLIGEYDIIK